MSTTVFDFGKIFIGEILLLRWRNINLITGQYNRLARLKAIAMNFERIERAKNESKIACEESFVNSYKINLFYSYWS
jgi:hypothetical protein